MPPFRQPARAHTDIKASAPSPLTSSRAFSPYAHASASAAAAAASGRRTDSPYHVPGDGSAAPASPASRADSESPSAASPRAGSIAARSVDGAPLLSQDYWEGVRRRQEASRARVRRTYAAECAERAARESARYEALCETLQRENDELRSQLATGDSNSRAGASDGAVAAEVVRLRKLLAEERKGRVQEALEFTREINAYRRAVGELQQQLARVRAATDADSTL